VTGDERRSPERELRRIMDAIAPGVLLLDAGGRILVANRAAAELFGEGSADELVGLHVDTWLTDAVDSAGRRFARGHGVVARALGGGTPVHAEELGIDTGCGIRWLRMSAAPFPEPDGGTRGGAVCSFVDVTDELEARLALAASEASFRLITEHASDLVVRQDLDGRFAYLSPSIRTLLGFDPEALVGTDGLALVHEDDVPRLRAALARLAADTYETGDERAEFRLRGADGSARWFEAIWTVICDGAGRPRELHAVARDIHDRKAAEQALGHLALHDPLTGLANRTQLRDRIEHLLDSAPPPGTVALLFIDLDRFKPVNDRFGHDAGDELLRTVASRLRAAVRPDDLVARVGGDEFVVVVTHLADQAGLARLSARLERRLGEPYQLRCGTVEVAASIGVAVADGALNPDELLLAADADMYATKRARCAARAEALAGSPGATPGDLHPDGELSPTARSG
jgi:diguanylate cyclase (GGDEF)-like protein/PAS domain S-box-containing protein